MERWGGWLGALALAGVLVGCGGAGNGGDSDSDTPPTTDIPEAGRGGGDSGVGDGGSEGGADAGTGGGGGTSDGGTGSDADGGTGSDGGTGGGGASTGGRLGWGRENGYVGNAWNFKAMEGARDGSFAVWTFCLTSCARQGETPRSRVDKLQGFRADGTPAWSMEFPRAMNVLSVEVSPSGRVIVGVSYSQPADIAGTRVPAVEPVGGGNLYVLVLSPEGKHLWSRGFKAEHRPLTINRDPLWQLRVAADDSDHVVLAGRWTGTLNLGGQAVGSMEDEDSFLFAARLDPQGEHLWSRSLKGAVPDGIHSVETFGTDVEGNLVLGGTAEAPDSGRYDHRFDTEGGEPYALSLSVADGSPRWRQVLKGTRGALTAVARTPEGGLAFAGSYLGRGFTFAGESLPEPRGIDALMLAVTAGGEPRWARTFRGSSKEEQPRLVSDDLGHLTLGVVTDGTLDLGGEMFVPRPRKEPRGEVYLARYDAEGRHVWSRLVGNHTRFSSAFFAYGIVAQPDGSATYGVQMTRASPVEVDGRTFNVEPDTAQLFLQFRH